jgi:hypothetical protein
MGEKETATDLPASQRAEIAGANPSGAPLTDGGTGAGPEPADGAIVKSKSNISNNREAAEAGNGAGPEPADGAIVKSKSNISNNREAADGDLSREIGDSPESGKRDVRGTSSW